MITAMTAPGALATLAAQGTRRDWGWMQGMMDGWWGVGLIMMLFWIGILVLIGVLIWRLLEGRGGLERSTEESALEILQRRYARGEIEREEFEEKKRDLA